MATNEPGSLPRIVLVQMEVAPGRPDHNVARMLERIDRHKDATAGRCGSGHPG